MIKAWTRRLTALTWISPRADADGAVCKPRPSVREATVASVRAGRMHRKVTPTKAGKEPWSRGARLHLGPGWEVGRRGSRHTCKHDGRYSCTHPPAPIAAGPASQQVGTEGAVTKSRVRGRGLGPHRRIVTGGQLAGEGPVPPPPARCPRSSYHIKPLNDLWAGQMCLGRCAHPWRAANSGRQSLKQLWPSVTPSL